MRVLLPALFVLTPVFAADSVPAPVAPVAPVAPPVTLQPKLTPPAGAPQMSAARAELMKEMREVQVRYQQIRAKVDGDPELLKLRTAAEEAQKAYREKLQELMLKDPAYAEIKAKREEIQAKMMAQTGGKPAGPVQLSVPPAVGSAQAPAVVPAPAAASVPAPAPAPGVGAPESVPAPAPIPAKP